MFRFNYKYLLLTIFFFLIEVGIERYFHGGFIRNVLGDYIIVFVMYCFVKTFFSFKTLYVAILVLLISYLVEICQYVDVLKLLNISRNRSTDILVGSSFDWKDMAAYTAAFITILVVEKILQKK
ncbi:Protein of unknown function [Mesonia phycicola]|uniref:DUF2809 domain-containing protein n=1 Tax=Mesonia phycicola TaxID=579105 RepID=A0A1M6CQB8_9FLAO|nr:DUF2809 domain-containing protein [Mesonia phycicola]SHI63212.1 Protein of unknown function [Mesonia phycicola]